MFVRVTSAFDSFLSSFFTADAEIEIDNKSNTDDVYNNNDNNNNNNCTMIAIIMTTIIIMI